MSAPTIAVRTRSPITNIPTRSLRPQEERRRELRLSQVVPGLLRHLCSRSFLLVVSSVSLGYVSIVLSLVIVRGIALSHVTLTARVPMKRQMTNDYPRRRPMLLIPFGLCPFPLVSRLVR